MPRDERLLVAVCGLPGVGKSTVSAHIAERIGATRLRSDVVRKELFADPRYTDAETDQVYEVLFARAEALLDNGEGVVIDATLSEADRRRRAREVAAGRDASFELVRVVCDRPIAERRIARRDGISDADVAVYHEFREQFEPVAIAHERIDNSGTLAETRRQIETLL